MLTKKTYQINQLSNRANTRKILTDIRKLEGVTIVNLDKDRLILNIEYDCQEDTMYSQILKIMMKYEKHVQLKECQLGEKQRKVLKLKGIDCGHCASRIESMAKRQFSCQDIIVDFATERFIIETNNQGLLDNIIEKVSEIVKQVDEHVEVMDVKTRNRVMADETYKLNIPQVVVFVLGLLFLVAYIIYCSVSHGNFAWLEESDHNFTEWALIIVGFLLVSNEILYKFIKNLINGSLLDENFLMTIACVGALITGHFIEGISVMAFYQVGEYFQERAVNYSRKSISKLMTLEATLAHLQLPNEEIDVEVESIIPGDLINIKNGEMFPLDGEVVEGKTFIDTKALTGESYHKNIKVGDEVLSGSINLGSKVTVKVQKGYGDSTISQILDLVENASASKAKSEKFITKFAKWYTPIVVAIALGVAILQPLIVGLFKAISGDVVNYSALFFGADGSVGSIYSAMVFLVISCPCALVISIPLSYFSAIGACSKRGILVKGSNYIEALKNTEQIVFDKTGTLTKGTFGIVETSPAEGVTNEELLRQIVYAEYHSTHPIANSLVEEYGRNKIFPELIEDFVDMPGSGVKAVINGSRIIVANYRYMRDQKIDVPQPSHESGLTLYVVKEKAYLGNVVICDLIRDEAAEVILKLKKLGVKRTYMLTGDTTRVANYVANSINIDEVHAELLPAQKVDVFESIKHNVSSVGKTVYIGDGINDAPVISSADIGIAMGLGGSEGTIAIADIVVMSDNLMKVNEAIVIAQKTSKVVYQNIIFALATKIIVMILTLTNAFPSIWMAIFADVGVSLLAIMNAFRIVEKADELFPVEKEK